MVKRKREAHEVDKDRDQVSQEEMQKRKERLLAQGTPSITGSIADAVVLKNKNVFFLTKPGGNVPAGSNHGYGLYYRDCRFLNTYEMKIGDAEPNVLVSNDSRGYIAVFELTNPEIMVEEGKHIRRDEIGMTWQRVIDGEDPGLYDIIDIKNYDLESVEFRISLTFDAQFESLFAIRGLLPIHPGERRSPAWEHGALTFLYAGADGVYRNLAIHFSPGPDEQDGCTAHFDIRLGPNQAKQIVISLLLSETPDLEEALAKERKHNGIEDIRSLMQKTPESWRIMGAEIRTNSLLLNRLIDRSLLDLQMLRTEIDGKPFIAAGVPWFATLFGRDSIITALQTLFYNPEIAVETLRILAAYQGKQVNEWRDEEPGKILHELRVGELARIGEIPHTPYYGTVDATSLFLILIARHASWTGDMSLFNELRDNIESALQWLEKYLSLDGDGYVEYKTLSGRGLINQGWKDSGDAIVNADGSFATPPIALVEVQGYAYMARLLIADLFQRAGEVERAKTLRRDAGKLRARFNRDFWSDDLGTYVLALQKDQRPVTVASSNPGHALWTGIADEEKARKTVSRLMQSDLFSGWGIRTLSTQERRYNPIGYHLGTVWPHDNAIIAAGFRRYGFDEAAGRIFTGISEAALYFEDYRLPELFAGFPKDQYQVPVNFPIACHPQAWAAGSVLFMLENLLGLIPEAFEQRLRIVRPMLPEFVSHMKVSKLSVGDAQVDLKFTRGTDGHTIAEVLHVEGPLDVVGENNEPVR